MFLWMVLGLLSLVVIVFVGLLLFDHLTPPATGAPSHALALQPGQTQIDRELAPLLATHPGKTGVVLVTDGLDAFAMRALAARKAGRSLDLQYYLWHDDMTGRLLAREVHAAAQRGVRVRILLDDLNAKGVDPQLMGWTPIRTSSCASTTHSAIAKGRHAYWRWCIAYSASTTGCTTKPGSPTVASP
ncbi:hypothetical protein [Thermomonas sp.]|uniref:hypothetical protein n=1 Tax=Thermomonas sp. TaxID=1971895 RepID=UPI0031F30804